MRFIFFTWEISHLPRLRSCSHLKRCTIARVAEFQHLQCPQALSFPESSFILLKMKFRKFSFKMKGFLSIHKEKKKKREKGEKTSSDQWKNNPKLCLLAKGPVVWARLWKTRGQFLMESSHSTHSYLCFSEVNPGPHHCRLHITLVTVPTISVQIVEGGGIRILSPLLKDKVPNSALINISFMHTSGCLQGEQTACFWSWFKWDPGSICLASMALKEVIKTRAVCFVLILARPSFEEIYGNKMDEMGGKKN